MLKQNKNYRLVIDMKVRNKCPKKRTCKKKKKSLAKPMENKGVLHLVDGMLRNEPKANNQLNHPKTK